MNPWASHLGPLAMAMAVTKGPIVEFGGGGYSTPMLGRAALNYDAALNRPVWTFEEDVEWYKRIWYASECHQFVLYHDLAKAAEMAVGLCPGLVFIDNGIPAEDAKLVETRYTKRKQLIRRFVDVGAVLVVHDTEEWMFCSDFELWRLYKHVWTFKPQGLPWTTVASQTVDLGELMHRAKVS